MMERIEKWLFWATYAWIVAMLWCIGISYTGAQEIDESYGIAIDTTYIDPSTYQQPRVVYQQPVTYVQPQQTNPAACVS